MADGTESIPPPPGAPAGRDTSVGDGDAPDDLSAFRPGDRQPFPGFWSPPPPRRGIFRRLLIPLLLAGLVLGSFILNFVLLVGSSAEDAQVVSQVISKGESVNQRIAVVSLTGEIDSNLSTRLSHVVDQVEKDIDVKALVVEIDTPGGEVTASDEIYDRLLRYKARRTAVGRSPLVVVSMKSQATSGGYYVACAADYIFAEPTTLTGNIGVLMPRFNFSGLMTKFGVQETTVVATGADFKHVGSPYQPETAETQAYLRSRIDQAFARFKQIVVTGRGARVAGQDVFSGKIFTATEAMALSLIDQVGYPQDAYQFAAGKAGIANPHVLRYKEPGPSLLGLVLGGGSASANSGASTTAGGSFNSTGAAGTLTVPTSLRPESLDALRTTRLLYR